MLAAIFVQGEHGQPWYKAGMPLGTPGVGNDTQCIPRLELAQLYE